MKYCEFCGKRLENGERCSCPEAVANAPKTEQKKKSIIIGVIFLAAAIIVAAIFAIHTATTKIDPFDYFTINFLGYNTLGHADISFNKDAMIKSIIGEEPDLSKEYFEWYESYENYWNQIDLTCSKEDDLTNGDTVTVTITAKFDAANKIKSGERVFTVQELRDTQVFDVFKEVEITFSGINGDGTVDVKWISQDEIASMCEFSFSKQYNLSSGESVIAYVYNAEDLLDEHGILISPAEKEFIVPTLDEYLKDPDLLSKEKIREFIDLYLAANYHEASLGFHYSDPEFVGTYFAVGQKGSYWIHKNVLMIFVKYDEFYGDDFYATRYAKLEFRDLIVPATGEISFTYDMSIDCGNVGDLNEHLTDLEKDYVVVAVDSEWKAETSQGNVE